MLHLASRIALGALALLSATAMASPWERFNTPYGQAPESVGSYSNGCLMGGEALPTEGPGYQTVRLYRSRNYGHPAMVQFLQDLGARVERNNLGIMLVADIAMPRGGRFSSGHRSHQTGLDADIWLRLNAPRLPVAQRTGHNDVAAVLMVDRNNFVVNERWSDKQARMIQLAAADERVARIFVHPAIKRALCDYAWEDRSWLRRVRPWWGHDSHFHVRLHCQPGEDCKPQNPPPAGDGCGRELASWYPQNRPKPKKPAKPVKKAPKRQPPPPPARCRTLLNR